MCIRDRIWERARFGQGRLGLYCQNGSDVDKRGKVGQKKLGCQKKRIEKFHINGEIFHEDPSGRLPSRSLLMFKTDIRGGRKGPLGGRQY